MLSWNFFTNCYAQCSLVTRNPYIYITFQLQESKKILIKRQTSNYHELAANFLKTLFMRA